MGTFLKKNWFVSLIIVVFAAMTVFYIYDTNKGKLKGKTSGGEDVVYSIGDSDVTASQYYDDLYKTAGADTVVNLFQRAVADTAVKTTNEMKDAASSQAASIISNYSSSYGSSYESALAADLASTGFTDLEEYLLFEQKMDKIAADYAKANFDDLKIRRISYILIKYDDANNVTANPTEAEAAKMKAVDDMLASGKTFAETATQYTEDESAKESGGDLGVIDKNTSNLDSVFFEEAMSLSEGQVSDWVKSPSFGYFKIMCTAATQKTLEEGFTDSDPYVSLVQGYDTTLALDALWEKAEELGIDFKGNADIEKTIRTAFSKEADSAAPEATAEPEKSAEPEATATPEASADTEKGN